MPDVPFIEPRNSKFAMLEHDRRAGIRVAKRLRQLVKVQRDYAAYQRDEVAPLLAETRDKLANIDAAIRLIDRNDGDDVVALYAVGFGPNGGVSEHSGAGKWISRALSTVRRRGGQSPTVCDIKNLTALQSHRFVGELEKSQPHVDDELVKNLSHQEIERFVRLATNVCNAIPDVPPGKSENPAVP